MCSPVTSLNGLHVSNGIPNTRQSNTLFVIDIWCTILDIPQHTIPLKDPWWSATDLRHTHFFTTSTRKRPRHWGVNSQTVMARTTSVSVTDVYMYIIACTLSLIFINENGQVPLFHQVFARILRWQTDPGGWALPEFIYFRLWTGRTYTSRRTVTWLRSVS